jgi:hypothetical protein
MSGSAAAVCIVNQTHAYWFLGAWTAIVLAHGIYRSVGQAPQDPHRSSGPVQ